MDWRQAPARGTTRNPVLQSAMTSPPCPHGLVRKPWNPCRTVAAKCSQTTLSPMSKCLSLTMPEAYSEATVHFVKALP